MLEVTPDTSVELLIEQLDPFRDYGERSYEEVVEGVRNGTIRIWPGHTLPQLALQGQQGIIKGSGRPVAKPPGETLPQWGRARFNRLAAEDFDEAYAALMQAVRRGDVRAMELFFTKFLGRDDFVKGDDRGSILEKLLELAARPVERVIEVGDGND